MRAVVEETIDPVAIPVEWGHGDYASPHSGLALIYESGRRLLRMRLTHANRYTFNLELLLAMRSVLDLIVGLPKKQRPDVVLIESERSDVFSFGGDLEAFHAILDDHDRGALKRYASTCIDVVHRVHSLCRHGIVSVSYIAGDALGGGLELALSCDFIVVEPDARLSLPERNFGSFPGMGAYSFLKRRIGRPATERMIISGDAIDGSSAATIGLIDEVAAGDRADTFLNALGKRPGTYLSVARAREEVPKAELDRIVSDWVALMIESPPRDRRRISNLAKRQVARRQNETCVLPGGSDAMPPNPFLPKP